MIIDSTSFSSPNYNSRDGAPITGIVLHTTEGRWASDLAWLCNPQTSGQYSPVSCHYVIAPDGIIYQIVDDQYRAWHAGVGTYQGCSDWNDISIGIEISHVQGDTYPAAQLIAAHDLVAMLIERYVILPDMLVCHRWIRPEDRSDPTNVTDDQFNAWVTSFYSGVDYQKEWGPYYPYVPDFGITVAWQEHWEQLGNALTDETLMADARIIRAFRGGAVVYTAPGDTEVWT